MAEIVYVLCAILSVGCAFLLAKSYFKSRSQLLFWSALCFGFLALNNVILFVDLVLFPQVEIAGVLVRSALGALAGLVLVFGLVWELT